MSTTIAVNNTKNSLYKLWKSTARGTLCILSVIVSILLARRTAFAMYLTSANASSLFFSLANSD